jgi:hypothetical protein
MRHLRLLIIALAAIFALALAAFALISKPAPLATDDDLVIKGGSIEIKCGKNHKNDNAGCLILEDGVEGKYKHKQGEKHITRVVVKNGPGSNQIVFDSSSPNVNLGDKPEIHIEYMAAPPVSPTPTPKVTTATPSSPTATPSPK